MWDLIVRLFLIIAYLFTLQLQTNIVEKWIAFNTKRTYPWTAITIRFGYVRFISFVQCLVWFIVKLLFQILMHTALSIASCIRFQKWQILFAYFIFFALFVCQKWQILFAYFIFCTFRVSEVANTFCLFSFFALFVFFFFWTHLVMS